MRQALAIASLLLFAACSVAGEPDKGDASTPDLEKARADYRDSLERARSTVLRAIAAVSDRIQSNKSLNAEQKLAQIRELRDEEKAFTEDGILPQSFRFKTAVAEYRRIAKQAKIKMVKAYETAINSCVKAKEIEKASALLAEKKALQDEIPDGLLGKWDVTLTGSNYRTEWTFNADGTVLSTQGGSKTGTWTFEKDKKRFFGQLRAKALSGPYG